MQVQVGKHWPGCRGERLQQRFQKQKQSTWVSLSPLSQNLIKKKPQWDDYISSQIICWLDQSLLTPQRLNIWRVTRQREREREREREARVFLRTTRREQITTTLLDMWPLCGRSVTATPAGITHSGGSLLQLPDQRREEDHGHRGPRCSGGAAAAEGKGGWSGGKCADWRMINLYVEKNKEKNLIIWKKKKKKLL